MFVHAREENNGANSHCMGLLLVKYISKPAITSATWHGLPAMAEELEDTFSTYITGPLRKQAVLCAVRAQPPSLLLLYFAAVTRKAGSRVARVRNLCLAKSRSCAQ